MKVLVCTDFSAAAAAGEREAARRFPRATLVVFHATSEALLQRIVETTGLDAAKLRQEMSGYADQRLAEVIGRLSSQGHRAVAELAIGDPVELALAAAAKHEAEIIVVGVDAGDLVGRFRTLLVRKARRPVLIIPAEE